MFEFDEAIKNLPGSTPARALVVKRALEYLDGLAAEARGDRSLQLEIATACQKVAEVQGDPMYPNLGDSKGALESSTKALAILESLARVEPDNQQVQLALAGAHQQISDVLDSSVDTAGAVAHSGEALKETVQAPWFPFGRPEQHAFDIASVFNDGHPCSSGN